MKITPKLLASTLIAAITALAGNAGAIVVGNTALPPPPSPQGGYQGSGPANAPWPNTAPAAQQGVMAGSSYDPGTNRLTLNNVAVATNTKHLWVKIFTSVTSGYNPPDGARINDVMNPAEWASVSAPGVAPGNINPTGATFRYEVPPAGGNAVLVFYQTWNITPQPASETVNTTGITGNLPAGHRITGIWALSQCTPTPAPGPLALAGLGLLMVARRRRD